MGTGSDGIHRCHRLRNQAPNVLGCLDKMIVGKVGIARCRPVSAVSEQLANQYIMA